MTHIITGLTDDLIFAQCTVVDSLHRGVRHKSWVEKLNRKSGSSNKGQLQPQEDCKPHSKI